MRTAVFMILCVCLQAFGADSLVFTKSEVKNVVSVPTLDSIKKQLHKSRNKIKELSTKEGVYLEQLELLEKNSVVSESYISALNLKIDTLSYTSSRVKQQLLLLSKQLVFRQRKMKQRLRDIYKIGKPSILEIILTSGTSADLLYRVRYFQQLNRYDQMLVHGIDSMRALVALQKRTLDREQRQHTQLLLNKEQEKREIEVEQSQRREVLKQIQAEKQTYLSLIKELERAQRELNKLVTNLQQKPVPEESRKRQTSAVNLVSLKGKLLWPVQGTVIKKFGRVVHPVYNTVTMSNGIDIKASKGTKIACIADGEVSYIGWMRGYGKFCIIDHFNGYLSVYAHLEKVTIMQNQQVSAGQTIAEVGETGSLNGPKLHFQMRYASQTVDPEQWLEKRE